MIPGYLVRDLRQAERAALQRTPEGALMRRAAYAVASAAAARLPSPVPGRQVSLLVGSGNNGGDALFAGAYLRRRGVAVTAVTASERVHPGGLEALRRAGGRVLDAADRSAADGGITAAARGVLDRADLVIDGLVGIGARPPLRPVAADLVCAVSANDAPILAIDVPSGIDPDTGVRDGPAICATATVTFGAASSGLFAGDNAGELIVADLGLAPERDAPVDVVVLADADVLALRRRPAASDDKYSTGVVGIVAGSPRYPGAAVLAVGAAVRLRPGLVRFAGPAADAVVGRWPEVVATDDPATAGRVQSWVVGPGMGTDGAALARLLTVCAAGVPIVVDADGLTLLAANPTVLSRRVGRRVSDDPPPATVLTPHAGEFSRLWPDLDSGDRIGATRAAARRSGAIVLLKGDRTVIAAPDGRVAINTTGTPWLASAGSGDVLSGLIGSMLAGGADPFLATAAAAHLHGVAGRRAAADGSSGAQALWDHLH